MSVFRVGQDIGDVDSFEQSAPHHRAAARLYRQSPEVLDKLGRVAVRIGANQPSVFLPGDGCEVGVAKLGSRFDECLQNRFQVERLTRWSGSSCGILRITGSRRLCST
jgi:hypothetical protein